MSQQPPARGSPSRCTCNELLLCCRPLRWAMELSFAPRGSGRWCNFSATFYGQRVPFGDALLLCFSTGKVKSFDVVWYCRCPSLRRGRLLFRYWFLKVQSASGRVALQRCVAVVVVQLHSWYSDHCSQSSAWTGPGGLEIHAVWVSPWSGN